MGQIIDGKNISKLIRSEIKDRTAAFTDRYGHEPKLAVILVGEDPASKIYVSNKHKACLQAGIGSIVIEMSEDTEETVLIDKIKELNEDSTVNGILVQLPLPKHLNEKKIIEYIDPRKDVDGLTLANSALLYNGNTDCLAPCTPRGVIEILKKEGIKISGKHAVIVGRSMLVGKPLAMLLLNENATVTVCHSRTEDLGAVTRTADILISAVGRPGLVKAEDVKDGATVIDVGTTRVDGKLRGDVDFDSVFEKDVRITPVPGGVGPMTITMLLMNTLQAAEMQEEER